MKQSNMKNLTEFLYGAEMKKAVECFDEELNIFENLNKSFFKENKLELRKCYILTFNNNLVQFLITNKKVSEELGVELNNCFNTCFKKLSEEK